MGIEKSRSLWDAHARRHPNDLLSQVRRTIKGKPICSDQIDMILAAIVKRLSLGERDVLLDLCCGNGMLTDRLFALCRGGLGVDFSEVLIDVAKRNFERLPVREYAVADVAEFSASAIDVERFTKVLCYGSLQYLPDDSARRVIESVWTRFPRVQRMFIGNHTDKELIRDFFSASAYVPGSERNNESALGRWRTREDILRLARGTGWRISFEKMPKDFYGAHYRFDVVLERPD